MSMPSISLMVIKFLSVQILSLIYLWQRSIPTLDLPTGTYLSMTLWHRLETLDFCSIRWTLTMHYQYEDPEGVSPPPDIEQSRRWRQPPSPIVNRDSSPISEEDRRRRTKARSRSPEHSASWSPSGRQYSPPTNPNNYHHPSANKGNDKASPRSPKGLSGPSKGYEHHTNNMSLRTDMREFSHDNGYSKEPFYSGTQICLPTSVTEAKHNLSVRHSDVKGKRKASGTELDNCVVAEQAVPELPVGQTSKTTLAHAPTNQNKISSSSKIPPRPPRNKSLLDSVKAHLTGNSGSSRSVATSRSLQRGSLFVLSYEL